MPLLTTGAERIVVVFLQEFASVMSDSSQRFFRFSLFDYPASIHVCIFVKISNHILLSSSFHASLP